MAVDQTQGTSSKPVGTPSNPKELRRNRNEQM